MKNKDIVTFSAVQPTGNLHLGNYLGAIKNWVDLQNLSKLTGNHKNYFCIADLHSITIPQDPKDLKESTLKTLALYIACGIDPKKSTIFAQSSVQEHAELMWILSCHVPMGWLDRMTQYKDKKHLNNNLGLYSYPVLMAADILLYQTDYVPVGNDQMQHLQLARDIAVSFNNKYKTDFFKIPEAVVNETSARVMSLRDGTKKMSKSDPSDYSRINLIDDNDTIALKIKKAICDEAGRKNLESIYLALEGNVKNLPTNNEPFKKLLTDSLISHIEPIATKYRTIRMDKGDIDLIDMLFNGYNKCHGTSFGVDYQIEKIKDIIGFVNPWQ